MGTDHDADAYADAVLVAVLRYLAFQSRRDASGVQERALSQVEAESVDDRARRCIDLVTRIKKGGEAGEEAVRAYVAERAEIDPLWALLAEVGVPALLGERDRRVPVRAYLN